MQENVWHWRQYIHEYFDLSQININGSTVNFNLPSDYFELTDGVADKLSLIGRKYIILLLSTQNLQRHHLGRRI